MELGLYTFGNLTRDPHSGKVPEVAQRYREILALARLVEDAGLDVFGVGEHHRLDLPISSPAVLLAAIGASTQRLRLVSAVTVLPTLDPVRVFQDFATADLTSSGRVEIIAGRGAFLESFPLFGLDVADQDAAFAEHLELLLQLNRSERVDWRGRFRPPLLAAEISPRPQQRELPIWLGWGGTPESAERAARLGLPLTLANISQPPAKFAEQILRYRQLGAAAGHAPERLRVALAGHLHVARDSQTARERFFPHYSAYFQQHAPKASYLAAVPRETFEQRAAPTGPLFVGSPAEIIDKLLYERELFGHGRFLAQIDLGAQPFATLAEMIELLGSEVAPVLRRAATASTT
jgi:alkanesulfonate monooxygenase SsuD/methylene tetrahydromethanopterin reductase-like flavin-dependent oxidoreductase (luciferase family)